MITTSEEIMKLIVEYAYACKSSGTEFTPDFDKTLPIYTKLQVIADDYENLQFEAIDG